MSLGPVLVFTAHADDAEFWCGGLIAKFAAEGRDVYEVITTDNGRGTFELDESTLVTQSRDKEAHEAARILGKKEIFFLGYPDGFLGDTPVNVLREQFMRFVRKIRPFTVVTFDPTAVNEPHPDHRMVATAACEAAGFANLPLYHPEHRNEGLQPHTVAETYYFAKNPEPARINTVVDITPFIDKKIEAICAHDSQMRMMIQDMRLSLQATGDNPEMLESLDPENYRPPIDMFVRMWNQRVGGREGYEYGEEFRYERAGDLIRNSAGEL
ncbi:MAG: PIG-L family deacetylase [Deltaproteobacteria bacterium]|nr:PIG-L family deacetylase [Deltaproteobacteria bacterium]MCB9478585.1 PIG-L family deacetylase [Deltaproteobacteria bacterium]MCB9488331.1 PIG-L family deacetylase [Deltaproteobacteria bacterium]